MTRFGAEFRAATLCTLILAIVCCGVYPLAVWGLAQILFPGRANGSLVVDASGTVRGSELLGQRFAGAKYFHPRPSAAGNGDDAANSGGSNLGPTSQKLRDAIAGRLAAYRQENGLPADAIVPADAVTASASGLDPHITARNAELQARRVATARQVSEEEILKQIGRFTEGPQLGVLGAPRVNVTMLNQSLDRPR